VFDLSLTKLLVLAVIALVVFGPHELPKIAQQAGRALRDLRRIAEGAKADLREGLGPEFQDFDFEDLNPRRFVQKHLLDDQAEQTRQSYDDVEQTRQSFGGIASGPDAAPAGTATATSARATLLDGEDPPFDFEAT
jgi:sec-independent protein translocase protein TatB